MPAFRPVPFETGAAVDVTGEAQQRWKSYSGCTEQQCAHTGLRLTSAHIWPAGAWSLQLCGSQGALTVGDFPDFSHSSARGTVALACPRTSSSPGVQDAMQGEGWDEVGMVLTTGVVLPSSMQVLFVEDFTTGSFFPRREDLYELIFRELYIEFTFWSVVVFPPQLSKWIPEVGSYCKPKAVSITLLCL